MSVVFRDETISDLDEIARYRTVLEKFPVTVQIKIE